MIEHERVAELDRLSNTDGYEAFLSYVRYLLN